VTVVLDVVSAILMLAGALIAVIAAIGLHRLPDVYARMHVATKPATLGIALCLSGAALRADTTSTATKLVLAIAFQLVTTPAAGHLLGRAAHAARAPVSKYTFLDELRPLPSEQLATGEARSEPSGPMSGADQDTRKGPSRP
jgi:multicomponent Na+:H+ antiporter subunit G